MAYKRASEGVVSKSCCAQCGLAWMIYVSPFYERNIGWNLVILTKCLLKSPRFNMFSQPFAWIIRNEYTRLHVLLPFLAYFFACYLVSYPSNVSNVFFSFIPWFETVTYENRESLFSRHLFTVKSIITPIAGIAFFIWCVVKARGVGPIISRPSTVHGSELGWSMVTSLMSCISNMATLVTCVLSFRRFLERRNLNDLLSYRNAPDFASRAKSPSAALWPQLFAVPIAFSLVSFIGIIVSSSSETIYGEAIWSPIDLLDRFLDGSPSGATRFGVWFISFGFIIAQLGTNISANSISAGCDLTALFPRFVVSSIGHLSFFLKWWSH